MNRKQKKILLAVILGMVCYWSLYFFVLKPIKNMEKKFLEQKATSHLLPKDFKAALKGTPCENAETYEAYNQCVVEYNKKISAENETKE